VVLSSKGWVRAAKGHEVDAAALSYREGDALLAFARGRSNQQAAFLDSSGRAYSTTAHTLPSARGNGEPLTGRFSPPAGAAFVGVAIGENDTRYLLATSFGYGFVTRYENFLGRNKAGKQLLNPDKDAAVLAPVAVVDTATDLAVAITSAGHLLAFAHERVAGARQRQGQQADPDPAGQTEIRRGARHRRRQRAPGRRTHPVLRPTQTGAELARPAGLRWRPRCARQPVAARVPAGGFGGECVTASVLFARLTNVFL
jgi:DNA gyrase/topoisomerase IV subunit A